ncbi:MAG: hypothetical protein WD771_02765 [Gemmatimonadaceae bacterium]
MTVPVRRLAAPLALAAAAAFACSEVAGPGVVAALDFHGIAFPAVVSGDTLRNAAGVATPLTAIAYNGSGDVIAGATIEYLTLDTGVTVSPDGYVIATRRDGPVRLIATIAGLQSPIRTIDVTREPDSLIAPASTTLNYTYALPDAAGNVSPNLQPILRSDDTTDGVSANVKGWLVRWRIVHAGDTLAPTDTTLVALWPPSGARHMLLDTTKADGASTRRLRIYANVLPTPTDSFIVVAEVRSRGALVPGSPVRFVVHVTPP